MRLGLLRRLGLILLAIAFLGGGLPRVAMFSVAAASTTVTTRHLHHGHATSPIAAACDPSGKTMPACQHGTDCLACTALDLPASARPVTTLRWIRLTYPPQTARLSGMTLRPELSPPIRQS